MADEVTQTEGGPAKDRSVNVWMLVAIVAVGLALIAGYLAYSYKGEVDDWEAAAEQTVETLQAAGVELRSAVESGVTGYVQQTADLANALEEAQIEQGASASELDATQQELADTQAELEQTQAELEQTQAALNDANAKLEAVGELVLPNGTYVGPVVDARVDPTRAIIFQEGSVWRVAEVSTEAEIMVEGQSVTLDEFAALLESPDPEDAALANADYQVEVSGGLVTSIQTAPA
jgi:hypothetical protein